MTRLDQCTACPNCPNRVRNTSLWISPNLFEASILKSRGLGNIHFDHFPDPRGSWRQYHEQISQIDPFLDVAGDEKRCYALFLK